MATALRALSLGRIKDSGHPHMSLPKRAIWLLVFSGLACSQGDSALSPLGTAAPATRGAWLAPSGNVSLERGELQGQIEHLRALGVSHLAIGVDVEIEDINRPELRWKSPDEATRTALRRLREAGFDIMLLPRIEHPSFFRAQEPKWRGDISMNSPADWDRFHDNYESMLVDYARLSAEEGVSILALGLEYRVSASRFPDRWRRFAKKVREVFQGRLTYSANWYEEFEEVKFWDALDVIGIGAYFEIADRADADIGELRRGWRRSIMPRLESLASRYSKPILFTEIGYPTFADAGARPWEWTDRTDKRLSESQQAACYRALFECLGGRSWFDGVFIWRYYTDPGSVEPWDYTPQGKEAEKILRSAFGR